MFRGWLIGPARRLSPRDQAAAEHGRDAVLRRLAERDGRRLQGTVLHVAAKFGPAQPPRTNAPNQSETRQKSKQRARRHASTVALLVELGADVNAKNANGVAPVDRAVENGEFDVADDLVRWAKKRGLKMGDEE